MGWRVTSRGRQYCFGPSGPPRNSVWRRAVIITLTATALPLATGGPPLCRALPERKALGESMSGAVQGFHAAIPMIPPDDRASTGRCDALLACLHVPCFQVQLDASRPRQAHRQANACAYHVPDVIEALRTWAGDYDLTDGQLTILAIEPAAGGRQPSLAGQPGGPGQPELRGFAFSTMPLHSVQRRDPDSSRATHNGTASGVKGLEAGELPPLAVPTSARRLGRTCR